MVNFHFGVDISQSKSTMLNSRVQSVFYKNTILKNILISHFLFLNPLSAVGKYSYHSICTLILPMVTIVNM